MYLCDWGFDCNNSVHNISNVLKKLENENSYTRAASIAIFNLRMRDAIEILKRGATQQPHLNMIAMALSGNIFLKLCLYIVIMLKLVFVYFTYSCLNFCFGK